MNLQICLISDQLLANYIPVMMHRPDQVHLVSSDFVKSKGLTARFQRMLEQQGFTVVNHDGMPDSDMPSIRAFAQHLAQVIQQRSPDAEITLNITDGNKLMTLGMWEEFGEGVQVIYTDTQHQCIEHLHEQRTEPLASVLDVRRYLQAYGVRFLNALSDEPDWQQGVKDRKPVTKYLAEHADRLGAFIGMINYLAHQAMTVENRQDVLVAPTQVMRTQPTGIWRSSLSKLQAAGLIEWDENQEIVFPNVESARYLGGIWLEEFAYLTALEAGAEHVACSVKINWEKSRQTINELDLILVHRNRMLVIECKTLRLGMNDQKDSDMVYKISDLGDELRGLFGQTWLVSARSPDLKLVERAKSRGITVMAAADLKGLRNRIRQWMEA